ncbi:hypothetical protein [Caloramator sp. Dgby_cultured_2]|uniref:hypothetical protein n=1 Tax=Caloramator sp. Dgby_cultured_2 TaxID=3029174 RepID=UPI00237DF44C|nr:hypothetical protein [Caloramator sp. Dgby_cultured_2]WDU84348.1 hypothetical protein PWK10_08770 [Caloramator sp. Dgby_cultured_2]
MCDTLVALKSWTKNGAVIFGKNSDREKDEPHVIIRVPRKNIVRMKRLNAPILKFRRLRKPTTAFYLSPHGFMVQRWELTNLVL